MNEKDLESLMKEYVDMASRAGNLGSAEAKVFDIFRGLDTSGRGQIVSMPTDQNGLVFFGRPMCNLSYNNIQNDRVLVALSNEDRTSYAKAIRAYLDPRSNRGLQRADALGRVMGGTLGGADDSTIYDAVDSALVDPLNCFIPLLTNTLTSISGFPELVGDLYASPEGMRRESMTFLDGTPKIYGNTSLTANFQNINANPVGMLFFYLLYYGLAIHDGDSVRMWPDNVIEKNIDYSMRVFKLVLDSRRQQITGIASTIVIATNSNIGDFFNHNRESVTKTENRDISIQFQTQVGMHYQDVILLSEFNDMVALYNPNMRPVELTNPETRVKGQFLTGDAQYFRVPPDLLPYMNYQVYPRINLATNVLEWYGPKSSLPPAISVTITNNGEVS